MERLSDVKVAQVLFDVVEMQFYPIEHKLLQTNQEIFINF
jgi:hypothetical protein